MMHTAHAHPDQSTPVADLWRTARGALVVLVAVFLGVHGLRAFLDTLAPPPPPSFSAAAITTTSSTR